MRCSDENSRESGEQKEKDDFFSTFIASYDDSLVVEGNLIRFPAKTQPKEEKKLLEQHVSIAHLHGHLVRFVRMIPVRFVGMIMVRL